jgi:hypothetical protein
MMKRRLNWPHTDMRLQKEDDVMSKQVGSDDETQVELAAHGYAAAERGLHSK